MFGTWNRVISAIVSVLNSLRFWQRKSAKDCPAINPPRRAGLAAREAVLYWIQDWKHLTPSITAAFVPFIAAYGLRFFGEEGLRQREDEVRYALLTALVSLAFLGLIFIVTSVVMYLRMPRTIRERKLQRQFGFGPRLDDAVVRKLGALANSDSSVKLLFATNDQRKLAQMLMAVFDEANWAVNFTNVALENHIDWLTLYGTQVRGANSDLVAEIVQILKKAGFADLQTEHTPYEHRNNPKWNWVQNNVQITIGRQN